MAAITDPKQMETYSTPEQIAEVVYEAATDGKDQLRYVAGADAPGDLCRAPAGGRGRLQPLDRAAVLPGPPRPRH